MKTVTVKLSESRLRKIISDEIKSLNEQVDPDAVKTVVTAAAKLHKAVVAFGEASNATMTNSIEPTLGLIRGRLEDMINNPSSYVDKPKVEPKVIKLRKVDDAD